MGLGLVGKASDVSTPKIAGSSPAGPVKHYVIVRADLPLGVMVAQTIHAAGESGPAVHGTHAIALAATNERALGRVADQLTEAGINHVQIREPDAPWLGQLMAIGIPPTSHNTTIHRVVRRLQLIQGPP
jgi:hypothetical protein